MWSCTGTNFLNGKWVVNSNTLLAQMSTTFGGDTLVFRNGRCYTNVFFADKAIPVKEDSNGDFLMGTEDEGYSVIKRISDDVITINQIQYTRIK